MKRIIMRIVFASLLIGLLVLSASGAYAAKKVTLTHLHYYSHGENWLKYIQAAAKDFMAKNPDIEIKVTVAGGPGDQSYPQKVTVMAAAGMAPDITEMYPAMAASFVANGFFIDLRPYIAKDKVKLENYSPAAIGGFKWIDGSIWGLPADIYPPVTFYNSDLFDEGGLLNPSRLGEKWTWDALVEMGKKLTKDTNGDGKIDQWGVDRVWSMWYRGVLALQAGGRWYDRYVNPTESMWNSIENEKALQFNVDIVLKHKIYLPYGVAGDQYYFWTGKSAIDVVDGPGIMAVYLSKADFKWGVTLQPRGPANNATVAVPAGWQISSQCKHPDAAWRWVEYLAANEESIFKFVNATGRLTPYIPIASKLPPAWRVFVQAANHPATFGGYVVPKATEIDPIVNGLLAQAYRGQISPHEALAQIHRQVSEILKGKK